MIVIIFIAGKSRKNAIFEEKFQMKNFFFRILISAISIIIVVNVIPGVHVDGFSAAFMVALVLTFLNAFLKPILLILTIPITLLSFGLFLFVLNAVIIQIADYILEGFRLDNFSGFPKVSTRDWRYLHPKESFYHPENPSFVGLTDYDNFDLVR